MILLAVLHSAGAYERFIAPNELLEAFTAAKEPDGTGMKLFVRHRRSRAPAILLLQNDRWIDASGRRILGSWQLLITPTVT